MQSQNPLPKNLEVNLDQFVGTFKNAFEPEYCERAIKYFERMDEMGFGYSRVQLENAPSHLKDTVSFNTSRGVANGVAEQQITGVPDIQDYFLDRAWSCFNIYAEKFSSLKTQNPLAMFELKIQKTDVGGGYHVWHLEQEGKANCNRILNVQLFLNTVEEGGSTEFLYMNRLIPAVQGTLLIYPGNYTHLHRGNPPRSGCKYLINSWLEY